jgi:hypothetical protein
MEKTEIVQKGMGKARRKYVKEAYFFSTWKPMTTSKATTETICSTQGLYMEETQFVVNPLFFCSMC